MNMSKSYHKFFRIKIKPQNSQKFKEYTEVQCSGRLNLLHQIDHISSYRAWNDMRPKPKKSRHKGLRPRLSLNNPDFIVFTANNRIVTTESKLSVLCPEEIGRASCRER